ncbi:hypothetical protein V1478_018442 [Vespula squamosa]|uniref:Uncharacterized protein n=1 Tax=Vespula squamosa TaxID=30214 RepID=A0ABD1ZVQ4_VESSQ
MDLLRGGHRVHRINTTTGRVFRDRLGSHRKRSTRDSSVCRRYPIRSYPIRSDLPLLVILLFVVVVVVLLLLLRGVGPPPAGSVIVPALHSGVPPPLAPHTPDNSTLTERITPWHTVNHIKDHSS